MTSIPRDDCNIYKYKDITAKEPEYSTLSYTWGRWRVRDKPEAPPVLPIKNTPWEIPAVEESHFTTENFQRVIQTIHETGDDWAWIDVGCIDQRRGSTQAAVEIGRQASIFKQAKSTFVWLSRLDRIQLAQAIDDILESGGRLYDHVDIGVDGVDFDDVMDKLHKVSEYLFSDPWFSSLWTLQEIVLRNDAIVLSAEGESVPWKVARQDQRTYMTMLINHCQNIYTSLEKALEKTKSVYSQPYPDKTMNAIQRVKQLILQVGFYYLFSTNPNVQFGTARYRTTKRREDRVYGIMQIYGLCVGRSARPDENPSMEELVIEFAAAINYNSAILGQFFIHVSQPYPGYTWRITEASTVPRSLMIYRDPNNMATINVDSNGNCIAAGKCCKLPMLLTAAERSGELAPSYAVKGWGLGFEILLDGHINGAASFSAVHQEHYIVRHRSATEIDLKGVMVLWLGNVQAEFSFASNSYLRRNVGLLLSVQNYNTEECVLRYERLGIAIWTTGEKLAPFEEPVGSIPWEWHDQLVLK
ncbi:hypothetical protein MKX08_010095 [Trichoderma sp. CBMAI-0020]|nr:hypothetical protein MKX08_010095 [Trichoderma sp. CBMAI-0020]